MSKCAKCKKYPGTQKWIGEGGALALAHGFYEMWCKVCVLSAQIDYAKKQAEKIPELIRANCYRLRTR